RKKRLNHATAVEHLTEVVRDLVALPRTNQSTFSRSEWKRLPPAEGGSCSHELNLPSQIHFADMVLRLDRNDRRRISSDVLRGEDFGMNENRWRGLLPQLRQNAGRFSGSQGSHFGFELRTARTVKVTN
ncbi:MAG: hypothetical protein ACTS43_02180, partial [Candidatus Hodgkinia cicadicola]